ncbi:Holliday junction resolvase RuvX [Candidatus Dojkabacteria bacterium]|uniref:Putative pre-16S rRNA nuclease n=1 Tax=Candidatus Dojkabacteria bacterium TaxID=2099670 RepID=A0A955L6W3_9BACT|nr:Holliday junction resolvase RuvX [Candidatus Dojkabacteria bacterium]
MIILSIDHGTRKLGLAVSDETGFIAAPLPTLRVKNQKEAIEGITQIADDVRAEMLIIGLPSGWEGKDSEQTTLVKDFAEMVKKATGLDYKFWDESYSSKQAEFGARGRKRANSDSEAARIILQEYLDWQREKPE